MRDTGGSYSSTTGDVRFQGSCVACPAGTRSTNSKRVCTTGDSITNYGCDAFTSPMSITGGTLANDNTAKTCICNLCLTSLAGTTEVCGAAGTTASTGKQGMWLNGYCYDCQITVDGTNQLLTGAPALATIGAPCKDSNGNFFGTSR